MQETGNNDIAKKELSIRLWRGGLSFSLPLSAVSSKKLLFTPASGQAVIDIVSGALDSVLLSGWKFSSVKLSVDTLDTVYVPTEVLSLSNAAWFLRRAGINVSKDAGCLTFASLPEVKVINPALDVLAPRVILGQACPAGTDSSTTAVADSYKSYRDIGECGPGSSTTDRIIISDKVDDLSAVMLTDGRILDMILARLPVESAYSPLHENLQAATELSPADSMLFNITHDNVYFTSCAADGSLRVAEVFPCSSSADLIYYITVLSKVDSSAGATNRGGQKIHLLGDFGPTYFREVKKYFKNVSLIGSY